MKTAAFALAFLLFAPAASARALFDDEAPSRKSEVTPLGAFQTTFALATGLAEQDLGYRVIRRHPTGIVIAVAPSILGLSGDKGIAVGPIRVADYFHADLRAGTMSSDLYADYLWFGFAAAAGVQAVLPVTRDIELGGRVAAFYDLDMSRGEIGADHVKMTGTQVVGRARYGFLAGEAGIGTSGYLHAAVSYRASPPTILGIAADRLGTFDRGGWTTTFRAFVGVEL